MFGVLYQIFNNLRYLLNYESDEITCNNPIF